MKKKYRIHETSVKIAHLLLLRQPRPSTKSNEQACCIGEELYFRNTKIPSVMLTSLKNMLRYTFNYLDRSPMRIWPTNRIQITYASYRTHVPAGR